MTTKSEMLRLIGEQGPLKDSDLARLLGVAHQQVNQAARGLAASGLISRVPGQDGVIRNQLIAAEMNGLCMTPAPRMARPGEPSLRLKPTLGSFAPGALVAREDLWQLHFEEHQLQVVPAADVPEAGLIGWNTVGSIPNAPGLYCFVGQRQQEPDELRVFYVGMTTHLWMVAKGQLPGGLARGGQRYGRPRHAGATRQRVNAEVARMSANGWTFSHWLRPVETPNTAILQSALRAEESRLISMWNLRSVGWNRA